jgi:hypothetical protein
MKEHSCRRIKKMAGDYYQKLLGAEVAGQVESHLGACPSCRREYEEIREILDLFRKEELPSPEPAFWSGLTSRIMTGVRQSGPEPVEVPWFKRIWGNPFSWPGYAWATAVILVLLTPLVLYTVQFKSPSTPAVREIRGEDWNGESGFESLTARLESLSSGESVRLGAKVTARLGDDLSGQVRLLDEDELPWDISRSLESLNHGELELLNKKIQTGSFKGLMEGKNYVG